jgi:hypothetical protein
MSNLRASSVRRPGRRRAAGCRVIGRARGVLAKESTKIVGFFSHLCEFHGRWLFTVDRITAQMTPSTKRIGVLFDAYST